MKTNFLTVLTVLMTLLCIQGCKSVLKTKGSQIDSVYYIIQSKAGNSQSSLQELKPYNAELTVTSCGEGMVSMGIEYAFVNEYGGDIHHYSLQFNEVPYAQDDQVARFDASGLSASCIVDGRTAGFSNASVKGSIGGDSSQLKMEGETNGYPFTIDIASLSLSKEAFSPEYLGVVEVDPLPLVEMEITNECVSAVGLSVKNELGFDSSFELAPNEARTISMHAEEYPVGIMVQISYADGRKQVILDSELLSSQCFVRGEVRNSWYLEESPTGAIVAIDFPHECFSVKAP